MYERRFRLSVPAFSLLVVVLVRKFNVLIGMYSNFEFQLFVRGNAMAK